MKFSHALVPIVSGLVLCILLAGPASVMAADEPAEETKTEAAETPAPESSPTEEAKPPSLEEVSYAIDNLFLLIAAVLVLFMQAGFAMVEAGFNAAKNAVNILFKNLIDVCLGIVLFWLVGYGLMYPGDEFAGKFFGFGGFGRPEALEGAAGAGVLNPQVDFLFQVAFAATAATIVSGAVAGRMHFIGYLIYSAFLTALIYPISGMWKWGGGWLGDAGFQDFAGSLVVHACGGFAGLAGAILLGPRIGRFSEEGKSQPMPGHNLTIATLGVFVLWIGWYGFNPGSQLAFSGQANTDVTMLIATNTTIAAATGAIAAMILSWVMFSKPDLSMALNGVLAGLVGITANCNCVSNAESMTIGVIAGILVVLGIIALDKFKIDDPVGAFPVHGLCGVWGGIATGIFGENINGVENLTMKWQIIGSVAIPIWAFVTMFGLFLVLKAAGLLRVTAEEEIEGLDISEHGMHAYEPAH